LSHASALLHAVCHGAASIVDTPENGL
jgi:hypothetical protein